VRANRYGVLTVGQECRVYGLCTGLGVDRGDEGLQTHIERKHILARGRIEGTPNTNLAGGHYQLARLAAHGQRE